MAFKIQTKFYGFFCITQMAQGESLVETCAANELSRRADEISCFSFSFKQVSKVTSIMS